MFFNSIDAILASQSSVGKLHIWIIHSAVSFWYTLNSNHATNNGKNKVFHLTFLF